MPETHRLDRLSDPFGFLGIRGCRAPGLDITETAIACAGVSKDKERRGPITPALTDVGAVGLLTDGVKLRRPHQPFDPMIGFGARSAHSDPGGAALRAFSPSIVKSVHKLHFCPLDVKETQT